MKAFGSIQSISADAGTTGGGAWPRRSSALYVGLVLVSEQKPYSGMELQYRLSRHWKTLRNLTFSPLFDLIKKAPGAASRSLHALSLRDYRVIEFHTEMHLKS